MNPFKSKQNNSKEVDNFFVELKEIINKILLQTSEDKGQETDLNQILLEIISTAQCQTICFKAIAAWKLTTQPKSPLPLADKVAIAAHEAYKAMFNG